MAVIEQCKLVVKCDHWLNLAGTCRNNTTRPVTVGMSGPLWHVAKDELRKEGWQINDRFAACPSCVATNGGPINPGSIGFPRIKP